MPTYSALPPLSALPDPVAAKATELLDLRVKFADLRREDIELNPAPSRVNPGRPDHPDRIANKADADLLAAAARDGSDISKVGTPNADELARRRQELATRIRGTKAGLQQINDEFHAVLRENFGAASEAADGVVDATRQAFADTVEALVATRRDHLAALAVRRFLDDAEAGGAGQVGWNPSNTIGDLPIGMHGASFEAVVAALRQSVAERERATAGGVGVDE